MTKQNIEEREGHEPGTFYREEHNREVKRETERDNLEKREGFSLRHILLDVDGPVVTFLTKTGELILLGLVWLLTSFPVLTIGTSTIALYHAIVKSVRHERGYPVREYFKAFRQHLK